MDLEFLDGISTYEKLTDKVLRSYFENKSEESTDVVTLHVLDSLVDKELRIDTADSNANSRIENLFFLYFSLLRRNGLK